MWKQKGSLEAIHADVILQTAAERHPRQNYLHVAWEACIPSKVKGKDLRRQERSRMPVLR